MNIIKKSYLILIIFLGLLSCNTNENCTEETDVNMQIGFYSKSSLSSTAYSVDSIWVRGMGVDSFLYKNKKVVKLINVPLKKTNTHTDYIVRFNNITDTISVFYQNNNQHFISLECGCVVAHTIDEVLFTKKFIKSVNISNRNINTINTENVQIFIN